MPIHSEAFPTTTLKTGISIATSVALLAIAGAASAAPAFAADKTVHCYGVNTCKGASECKTAANDCKGQNVCKGHGFKAETENQCKADGGSLTEMPAAK